MSGVGAGASGGGSSIPISLENVSARAKKPTPSSLVNVSFAAPDGEALAIIGAPKDGTSLLFDVLQGWAKVTNGRVTSIAPERIARVSLDAPLPDALRVEEIVQLSAEVRGEAASSAGSVSERLGSLNLSALAKRRAKSLSLEERRAVSLAIALTSTKVDLLLVEEPLVMIDPVAPRLIIDALRECSYQAASSSSSLNHRKRVIATTASPRDAMRIGDALGVLTNGKYSPLDPNHTIATGPVSVRVIVTPAHSRGGATKLVAALGNHDGVMRVETHAARASGAVTLIVTGTDLATVSKAITHAVAVVRVDVELVEPIALPLDALRMALATPRAPLPAAPVAMSLPPPSDVPPPAPPAPEETPAT